MQVLLYIAPLFIALAIYEWKWGKEHGKQWSAEMYRKNVFCAVLAFISQQIYKPLYLIAYHWLETRSAIFDLSPTSIPVIVGGLLASDLVFYCWHRMSHSSPFLWGGHAIHHTSQDYNLGLTFRLSAIGPMYMLLFHTPLALIGVPVEVIAVGLVISTVWQSWLHTELIKKVPIIEKVFVTPASHAVHHATNKIYTGKNFGATLTIWDQMFGTHQNAVASEPLSYVQPYDSSSHGVLESNIYFYRKLLRKHLKKKERVDLKAV
jgi:alkylglycerol monooxygenase